LSTENFDSADQTSLSTSMYVNNGKCITKIDASKIAYELRNTFFLYYIVDRGPV